MDVLKVAVQDAARGSLPRRAKVDAMGDHVGTVVGEKERVVDGSLGKRATPCSRQYQCPSRPRSGLSRRVIATRDGATVELGRDGSGGYTANRIDAP